MKHLLICIDDTDNIESIGTGQVLENMCCALHAQGFGESGFISRHQLLIHESIAYTSHNSSMCCNFNTSAPEKVLSFAQTYLENNAAAGSDPGLCILAEENISFDPLIDFGKKAQSVVLQKSDAYSVAAPFSNCLFLSEHGGSGEGVIGALAGIGLRLSGCDGKIRGKLIPQPDDGMITVRMFCMRYHVDQVVSEDLTPLPADTMLIFRDPAKAILVDHRKTVIAEKKSGCWLLKPHQKRKR